MAVFALMLFQSSCSFLERRSSQSQSAGPGQEIQGPDSDPIAEMRLFSQIQRSDLNNGLQLMAGRVPDTELVQMTVFIPVGFSGVPEDSLGLPWWAAHGALSPELRERLQRIGGDFTVSVDEDSTHFRLSFMRGREEEGAALLGDILRQENPLASDSPPPRRALSYSERAVGEFRARLLPHLGFAMPYQDLSPVEPKGWLAFRTANYCPDGAFATVVGALEPELGIAALTVGLESWSGTRNEDKQLATAGAVEQSLMLVPGADWPEAVLVFGRRSLGIQAEDYVASLLATRILAGHAQGRVEQGLLGGNVSVSQVGGGLSSFITTGSLEISITTDPESMDEVLGVVRRAVASLHSLPLTENEIRSAYLSLQNDYRRNIDGLEALSQAAADELRFGLSPQSILEEMRSIEVEHLQKTVRSLFSEQYMSYMVMGPLDKLPEDLSKGGTPALPPEGGSAVDAQADIGE